MLEMEPHNPLVYILMPCYNGEKYLLEQLMSIYYQNYTNRYLIFVNDGSTDNSENILRDWISHYNLHDKVKVITKENGGVNSAVQRGLEEIKNMCDINNTNSLISFCDCDDLWTRDKLKIQVEYMLKHDECGLSFHDLSLIDEDGILTKPSQLKNVYKCSSFFYLATIGNYITSTEMMFKAKLIDNILPMPTGFGIYQDFRTVLVLSLIGINIQYINKCLAYYRQGHESLMSLAKKSKREKYKSQQYIYKYLQEKYPEYDISYIINYNYDRYVNRYRYGIFSIKTYCLILLKYTKVFFLGLKVILYKLLLSFKIK